MARGGSGSGGAAGATDAGATGAGANYPLPRGTSGDGGSGGAADEERAAPGWAGKPCKYCHGAHDPSVHSVTDTLGGSSSAAMGEGEMPSMGDVQLLALIDELAQAGHRLFGLGQDLGKKLKPALDRIKQIEAGNPAGEDEKGQEFHRGYDRVPARGSSTTNASEVVYEAVEKLADGYAAKGIEAQKAAKAYADVDDINAAAAHKFVGVWGRP